jgi:capsule polysaccharide export protein KpsE/RkpR
VDRLIQRTSSHDGDLILAAEPDVRELHEDQGPKVSPILAVAQLLWSHRLFVGKVTLIAAVATAVIALLIPNTYTALVRLMPPDTSTLNGGPMGMLMGSVSMGEGGSGSSGASSIGSSLSDLLGGQKPGPLFVGLLNSRTVADGLINRFDLRKVYWRKTYLAARGKLKSNSDISEDKRSGIITIEVRDHDKARSAALAQAYVVELDRLLANVNTSSASRERAFLEQRLTVISQELHDSAKQLSDFSSQNSTLDPEEQGKAMVESTALLQGQLIATQSELSGLEQIYTADNVRVRSLRAHVAELQAQLNKLGGKNYNGSTTLDPNTLYPSMRQLPVMALRYEELYRKVKIDETVFKLLTEEFELAKVEEAKETPTVKVLDATQVPEKKSGPPRMLITLGGAFLGFVFAGCWVIGRQFWNEIDPQEPHKAFLTQEIIPAVHRQLAYYRRRLQHLRKARTVGTESIESHL